MPNPVCHFEILTNDPAQCRAFYEKIFGWSFEPAPGHPEYTLIQTGAQPGGGMMKRPEECPAPTIGIYVAVEDIDQTLGKVTAAGGKVVMQKTAIAGVGHIAVFVDPEHIGVGLLQPE